MGRLTGHTALVTGGTRGIGKAFAVNADVSDPEAVAYFAGEEAGYTTAQVLVVSGGY